MWTFYEDWRRFTLPFIPPGEIFVPAKVSVGEQNQTVEIESLGL